KAGLYHETITWAYLLLIRERMERQGEGANASFEAFARANPDLMTWKPSVLAAYYRDETLASPLARRTFVMPDRLGAEAGGGGSGQGGFDRGGRRGLDGRRGGRGFGHPLRLEVEDEQRPPDRERGAEQEVREGNEEDEERGQAEAQALREPALVPQP